MSEYTFNTSPVVVHAATGVVSTPSVIEATPNLRRASLAAAVMFGGPLVRDALQVCPLSETREHIIVDTKVTMLMDGWYPSIPGWHTDGVPRGKGGDPAGKGLPNLDTQVRLSSEGRTPLFHTIIFGIPNLTEFLADPLTLTLRHAHDRDLYKEVSHTVTALGELSTVDYAAGQWISWDWWNIHRAVPSDSTGWRLLIRVTESDIPPNRDKFFRAQSQVYVPTDFGW